MGQMDNLLTERQQGSLSRKSEINPRDESKEHVKAITLRSGTRLATQGQPSVVREEETKVVDRFNLEDQMQWEQPQEEKPTKRSYEWKETEKQAVTVEPSTPVPYPQRLRKNKLDKHFTKFMEVFNKLHINIPFTDVLEHMPSYVKFMKDILSHKIRLSKFEIVNLTEE